MEIRRRVDNFLLSDRIHSYVPWDKWERTSVRATITGVPVVFARQKAQILVCKATATFASDDPCSSVPNFREIIRLHEANQLLRFTDREGATTDVKLLDWGEPQPWEEVRHKTLFDVTFTWLHPTPRWC